MRPTLRGEFSLLRTFPVLPAVFSFSSVIGGFFLVFLLSFNLSRSFQEPLLFSDRLFSSSGGSFQYLAFPCTGTLGRILVPSSFSTLIFLRRRGYFSYFS